jgi:uncharacterized membrane protein YfcA
MEFINGIEAWQGWLVLFLSGMLVAVAKTGVPGIGITAVVLMASVMDAKASVGFMLPVLIMGDIFAVSYYRRHAVWSHLFRLMPPALVGIVIGYFLMGTISSALLRPLIGGIVIALLILDEWRTRMLPESTLHRHWAVAVLTGVAAGITTMLANAAGPLITIYFLSMRFEKEKFIGTAAWYFLVLNLIKVPFFIAQDPPLITLQSLGADFFLLPAVALGALIGIVLLKRIPQKWFVLCVKLLTLAASVKLLLS